MPTVLSFNEILAQLSPAKPAASAPSTPSGGGDRGEGGGEEVVSNEADVSGTKYCVFLVSCGTDYCGAKIGSGATFCVRHASQCSFKLHAVSLEKILMDDTYYVAKSANVAFTEPRLDAGWVMTDLAKSWDGLKLSADDWTKRFDVAHRSRGAATKAEVDRGLEDQKKAKLYQTPSKIKPVKGSGSVSFANKFSPYKPIIEDKDGDKLDNQSLTVVARHLESGVEELAQQAETLGSYTQGGFDTMVQATQMVEEKVRNVDRQIGKALPMTAAINAPTIWGILGLVGEEIKSVAERFTPKAEVEAAINRVKKLEDADLAGKAEVGKLEEMALGTLNAALGKINSQEEKIKELEGALSDINTMLKFDGRNIGVSGTTDLNLGATRESTDTGRLTGLESHIEKLENNNDEQAVRFSKLGIRNSKDINAWVCQEFQNHRYGLVVDVYTFLERVAGDSDSDQAAMLNLLDKQMKLKLSTGSEALTLCGL